MYTTGCNIINTMRIIFKGQAKYDDALDPDGGKSDMIITTDAGSTFSLDEIPTVLDSLIRSGKDIELTISIRGVSENKTTED